MGEHFWVACWIMVKFQIAGISWLIAIDWLESMSRRKEQERRNQFMELARSISDRQISCSTRDSGGSERPRPGTSADPATSAPR